MKLLIKIANKSKLDEFLNDVIPESYPEIEILKGKLKKRIESLVNETLEEIQEERVIVGPLSDEIRRRRGPGYAPRISNKKECPFCKVPIEDKYKFCPNCGISLKKK
jgi:hypothetical protein